MDSKRFDGPVPSYYRCPISLEIMRDPVTVSTGHTYDRCNIERWFDAGHRTCPASGQSMTNYDLIPNVTLRRVIQEWCIANFSKDSDKPHQSRPVKSEQVRLMLESISAGTDRMATLRKLCSVAQVCEENRVCLIEEGAIPILGSLLAFHSISRSVQKFFSFGDPSKTYEADNNKACEEALETLALLAKSSESITRMSQIAGPRQMASLSWFLSKGSLKAKVNAAIVLERLIVDDESIVENVNGLEAATEGLVNLLREDLYPKAIRTSLTSLHSICMPRRNRLPAIEAGLIGALLGVLPGADRSITEGALAILVMLCAVPEGRVALTKDALALPVVLRNLLRVSKAATEHAMIALRAILRLCPDTQLHHDAVEAGAFMQLLLVLQSDCTPVTKQIARELLKLLQSSCRSDACLRTLKL